MNVMKEKVLLLCIVLMCSFSSYGQSGQIGNISWNIMDSVLTISGTGDMPDFEYCQEPWYPFQDGFIKVVIEDSITSIGNSAFCNCRSFASIEIPCTIRDIGSYAFSGCVSLSNIKIPNSGTYIG